MENPWDTVDEKYPVGAKVHGKVRNLTDFGAFIELEEGIDGLVHVSDISWGKKIKHPKDVLKKDQEIDAIVTSIDRNGQRLSLSMKDLTPSAWETFVATHRPGDVVRGKVSRFTNFGVFVELGEGLEGLCHISELSEERIEKAEEVAKMGQDMDFKILRIDTGDQKIGLSHRAVGKDEQPAVDTKIYSTEAKGGMASLGELAKLKFGGAPEEAPAEMDPEEKKRAKQAAKKAKAQEFAAKQAEAEKADAEKGEAGEPHAEEAVAETESAVDAVETPAEETVAEAETAVEAATVENVIAEAEVVAEASTEEVTEPVVEAVVAETQETPAIAEEVSEPAAEEAAASTDVNDAAPTAEGDATETAESDAVAVQETSPEAEVVSEETTTDKKPAEDAEVKTA